MWFGTQDGLNRYDGYEFRVFRHNVADSASLGANWIWSIREDSSGHIWVSTFGGGLSRFDRDTEKFTTFKNNVNDPKSISHNTVWDFIEHPKGTFWVATNNGLNRLYLKKNKTSHKIIDARFEYIFHDSTNNNIFRIIKARGDFLWLTAPFGLYRFEISTNKFTFYDLTPNTHIFDRYLGSASPTNPNHLWISSGSGLFRFNTQTKEVKLFSDYEQDDKKRIINNRIVSVLEDKDSVLWVGTATQLSLIYPSGKTVQIKKDPYNPNSLGDDYISSIYQDRNGLVWLGTRGGIDYYRPLAQKFKHVHHQANNPNSLSSSSIISLTEDSFGDLWIGTNDGLDRYNPRTEKYDHYFENRSESTAGPSSSYILSVLEDSEKNIWIGTRGGGVCRWNRKTGKFKNYVDRNLPGISTGVVLNIIEDWNNNIWLGTNGAGLHLYDRANDTFVPIPWNIKNPTNEMNDLSVFALFIDSKKNFFVGTAAGGVNVFNPEERTFLHLVNDPKNKSSLSNNRVISFIETKSGAIWVGTAQGLNKMTVDEDKTGVAKYTFRQYLASDGLPNEVIYGILEDDLGYLWVSTNNGIAKIDVSEEDIKVQNFTVDDGLQNSEFNQNALKDSRGLMYFGGINGYNVFDPLTIKLNGHRPPVRLTHLKILDKEVLPSPQPGAILQKSITETKKIILPWKANVFSLEFSALDLTTPEKNQYAYKMDGFDKDWIYSGTRRYVTYTNLDAGDYIFRVKASNNDGAWNEEGTALEISITPPPWKTWWAYALYLLIFSGLIGGYIRFKINEKDKELETFARIERAKSEERDRVRKKASVDFHDEAGNLITKIALFVELTKRKLTDKTEAMAYLEKIEENTKQLSGGMRDFIWALDPGKDNLMETLSRLEDFGNSMFEYSEINFRVLGLRKGFQDKNLAIDDRRSILLIFKEAMNNCLKYSRASEVYLKIVLQGQLLKIELSDNGAGFDLKETSAGYGLQNMRNRAKKIGAELTIFSLIKSGTKVLLSLNLEKKNGA